MDTCKGVQNLSHLMGSSPAEAEQGDALPSCVSVHAVRKCPFHGPSSTTFFCISVLLVSDFPVYGGPQHSDEVLGAVPKHGRL